MPNVNINYHEPVKPIKSVVIELTEEEAQALKMLTGVIGGNGRCHELNKNLYQLLDESGIKVAEKDLTFFKNSMIRTEVKPSVNSTPSYLSPLSPPPEVNFNEESSLNL